MMFSPKAWPDSSTVVKPMHSAFHATNGAYVYCGGISFVPSVLRAVGHQRININLLVDSLRCYHSSSASSVEALTSSSDISCSGSDG